MPTQYVVKEAPILDEHTLTDDDGNPVIELTESHLRAIAARNNRRMRNTGDIIPVVIGHTKDEEEEPKQPPIVGWASHLTVKPFGRTGKKAIYAKFRVPRNKVHLVNKYPRRSIELWLSDWKIDPISLLGATTPERDLGLLQFSADGRRKYRRTLSTPMEHESLVNAVVQALQQTDVWKWAESQMKHSEGPSGEGEPAPGGEEDINLDDLGLEDEGDEGLHEAELSDLDNAEGDIEEEEDKEGEEPVRMSAGSPAPAASSGTNTFAPGGSRIGRRDKQRMQRDGLRIRMSRLESAVATTQKENKALRIKLQRKEREADLIQLEAEGIDLDRAEELDLVSQMSEEMYRRHLATMRKRYRKAPINRSMPNFGDPAVSRTRSAGRSREHAMEVAKYAHENNISYEDALDQFSANKTA